MYCRHEMFVCCLYRDLPSKNLPQLMLSAARRVAWDACRQPQAPKSPSGSPGSFGNRVHAVASRRNVALTCVFVVVSSTAAVDEISCMEVRHVARFR